MPTFLDARIPVIFGGEKDAGVADALLFEGEAAPGPGRDWFTPAAATDHQPGCACCTPRNGAGMALARLMLARGRGTGLFFNRVIAVVRTEAARAALRAALDTDPIASSFFREELPSQRGTLC